MGSSLGRGLLGHVETPEYFGTTWLNCSLQEHGLAEGQSKSAAAESLWLQLSLELRSLSISRLGIHFSLSGPKELSASHCLYPHHCP